VAPRRDVIFVSHSTLDGPLVSVLTKAVQQGYAGELRLYNTSAGVLRSGRDWREQVLRAIHASHMVIVLATPDAFASREVCFEIGAAAALERTLLPARAHFAAEDLPLGLDRLESPDLTTQDGWRRLLRDVAAESEYMGEIVDSHAATWAAEVTASADSLVVVAEGHAVYIRNQGRSDLVDLRLERVDAGEGEWLAFLDGKSIAPLGELSGWRPSPSDSVRFELSWMDARSGKRHSTVLEAPGEAR
jgi:hypothetical protein